MGAGRKEGTTLNSVNGTRSIRPRSASRSKRAVCLVGVPASGFARMGEGGIHSGALSSVRKTPTESHSLSLVSDLPGLLSPRLRATMSSDDEVDIKPTMIKVRREGKKIIEASGGRL